MVGGVKALFKAVTFHGVVSPGTIAVAWEGNAGLWKQPSGSIVHHTKAIPSNPLEPILFVNILLREAQVRLEDRLLDAYCRL